MVDESERKTLAKIKVICDLAAANFPGDIDVTISVNGQCSGSVKVPCYPLLAAVSKALADANSQ